MNLKLRWTIMLLLPSLSVGLLLPADADAQSGDVPERSELDVEYTWNLERMYPSLDAWEADFGECAKYVDKLASYEGVVTESPQKLGEYLALRDEAYPKLERLFAFAMLMRDQDTRESNPQAMFDRVRSLAVRLSQATSWFEPQVLSLPENRLMNWVKTEPRLNIYEHSFENLIRQQEHVLSAREEELMAMVGKVAGTPQQAFNMLTNADMEFPTIKDSEGNDAQVSEGRYILFMEASDRDVRRRAFKALLGAYLQYKNTIAATLAGSIHGDVFQARARNYDSALHAALAPDNVPVEVYHNLIDTIHDNLPTLHRYMELRRQQLGIDNVHLYDTFVPLVRGAAPKIEYEDAVATIIAGLQPLGPEYLEPMIAGFGSRWIDVYENKGKRSGAYSMGTYLSPPYILLNYNNTYNDMFTTAHEMGHSMHSWFTAHNQPPVYGDYPIFLAEVASTCNEVILGEYLRKQARAAGDTEKELFLVNLALESIRGTVINQTMWAEYELMLHEAAENDQPLTYETMADMYGGLVKRYFGPAYAHDDEVDGYWLRIPHFYRGFYVYKYATSYSASVALAKRVLSGDPEKLEAYLGFLKAGSSDYPIEILKRAGVDMNTPKPIEDTMTLFGELLDDLERLLKQS